MLTDAWQVAVYDRNTGKTFVRTTNIGGGMRPTVSRDGRWLAFGSRHDGITGLRLRDLQSGDEIWLAKTITRDDMESRYTRDMLPGFAFTPDSKAIVISYGGKIWKVDVPSGTGDTDSVHGGRRHRDGAARTSSDYPIDDSTLTVRQIRDARPSPDGQALAFTALDKLWSSISSGCPSRPAAPPAVRIA